MDESLKAKFEQYGTLREKNSANDSGGNAPNTASAGTAPESSSGTYVWPDWPLLYNRPAAACPSCGRCPTCGYVPYVRPLQWAGTISY